MEAAASEQTKPILPIYRFVHQIMLPDSAQSGRLIRQAAVA